VKLVVGLGNPGAEYLLTRHNAGWMVADLMAVLYEARWKRWKSSMFCKIELGGEEGVLIKPQTYMNRSGLAVKEWLSTGDWSPEDILVIHDEVDLPKGVVRLKMGGGTAGHNGLKSIVEEVGTSEFGRLRIGVGRPLDATMDLAQYLLTPLTEEEIESFIPIVKRGAKAVELWWTEGMNRAMNVINRRGENEGRGGEAEE
jgi:PTH1 family peptidyl-tRNA hydrolase